VLRCFTLFPLFSVFSFWPFAAFHAKLAPWPLMHPCESHSDGGRRDNRMWGRVKTPRNGPYNLPDSIFPPASTNQAARVGKTKGFPFSRAYHEPFCEWRFGLSFSAHPPSPHSRTPNPHTTSHPKLQHGLHCLHLHRLRRRPQGVQGHGTCRARYPASFSARSRCFWGTGNRAIAISRWPFDIGRASCRARASCFASRHRRDLP